MIRGVTLTAIAGALARFQKRRERGQIIVLFAFGFVALIGCVGLVVDLGVLMTTRRSYQKIADTCAVVGAQSGITAKARAESCVTTNNIAPGDSTVNVPPSTGPYQAIPGDVEVRINRNAPTVFMRALGVATVPLGVRAVAHSRTDWEYGVMGLKPGVESVKTAGTSNAQINGNACAAGDFKVAGSLNIAGVAVANGSFQGTPNSTGNYSGAGSDPCEDPNYPLPTPLPTTQGEPLLPNNLNISGALCIVPITTVPVGRNVTINCSNPAITVQIAGPRDSVSIQGSNKAQVVFLPSAPSSPLLPPILPPPHARFKDVSIQGDGQVTLAPGWYDTITSTSGPDIKMDPGLYLINTSYDQSGSGKLTGSGVSIIVGKEFEKTGGGDVTLSCCASEMKNNVLIYHYGEKLPGSPWSVGSGSNGINIIGQNSTVQLKGNIYSPLSAQCDDPCIQFGGNATSMTIEGQVAAPVVEINGTGLTLTFTGSSNDGARNPRLVE